MTIKLNVVAYYRDGSDGGGSIFICNNLDELREARFKPDNWNSAEKCEKRFQSALSGKCPYEYGEISNLTIEVEATDGGLRLARYLHIHYGQQSTF